MSSNRTRGREYALQILYEIDTSAKDPEVALRDYWENFQAEGENRAAGTRPDDATMEFTKMLVEGVMTKQAELDLLVEKCSINWRLERMPRVDRNVLRLACWELVHTIDVPKKVVINEAIELGKRYGSEESGAFINGILDRVAAEVGRGAAEPPEVPKK
jgi:N utilization substance protein B